MPLPKKLDFIDKVQTENNYYNSGRNGPKYSMIKMQMAGEYDPTWQMSEAINSLIDEVEKLQSKGGTGGMDGNIILEIVKENNKQWMELLKFMKEMKKEST